MLNYWIWLAIYVFLPMLLVIIYQRKIVSKYAKTIIACGIGSLMVAGPWDYFAIRNRLWSFPPQEILGIWLMGLPLEEWIFISFIGMEICMMSLVFVGEMHE